MTEAKAARELATLPPDSRRILVDLIGVLRQGAINSSTSRKRNRRPIEKEAFLGLWGDRKEMTNSTQWVISERRREWNR
jgi:hypothetical protein